MITPKTVQRRAWKLFFLFAPLIVAGLAIVPAFGQTTSAAGQTASTGSGKQTEAIPGLDKQFIDSSANPCDDFFQYACGNFDKLYSMPADQTSFGTTTIVFNRTEQALHVLLTKVAADTPGRTPNEQKSGDFYASCMDTDAIQARGLEPLAPELALIADVTDKKQLTAVLVRLQLVDVNAFFDFGEQQDFKDAQKQVAVVDQGGLGLPERDYYFRAGAFAEKTRREYVEYVANTLKLTGEPEAKASSDAAAIMRLETALAAASMNVTERRNPKNVYHPMPLAELAQLAPVIDWASFFEQSGAEPIANLNVVNPDFFKALNTVLQTTDLDTIKAYLRWQLINSTPGWALPKALDEDRFDFYGRALSGQPIQRARWKRCVQATNGALGEAVGQIYVASQFSDASKAATLEMVHDIEAAMEKDIDSLDWMSPETKTKAKEKLRLVADKIGYPDRWRDYSALKIVRGDAIGNAQRASEFENHRQLAKIGKPVDRGEWKMTPATVNAYYAPSMNDINFPAGILQPPLYDPNSTDAENYGHVGAIVGHELSHGFDDQGRLFDGKGNLASWWTTDDAEKFTHRTDCEVAEYGNFTAVGDLKVNGKLTLGENTADNGGLRLAYLAFLSDARRKGINLDRQEDGYTPLQQFFLAYAQSWCGSIRPERLRLNVQTDPHSPHEFRVNGVVQNMPEFGKVFGCKPGQPMMPVNYCRVW